MFGKRKGRKAREKDPAASYEDPKNNMMSSAEERVADSMQLDKEVAGDFLDKLAAPQGREALFRAPAEKSNIQMMEFKDYATVEDKLDPTQKAARDVVRLQKFQDPMDKSYQYQLLDTGDYAVFRNGKRTGTAKKDSRAFESIANGQRGLDALPLLNQE